MTCKEAIKSSKYNRAINLINKGKRIIVRNSLSGKDNLIVSVYAKDPELSTITISKWRLNQCNNWVPDDIDKFPDYIPQEQHYRHILAQYKRLMKDN